MSRPAAVPAVAVALALVLGTAVTTAGVRRLDQEQVMSSAPAPPLAPPPPTVEPPAPDVLAALEERVRPLGGRTTRLDDAAHGLGPLSAEEVLARRGSEGQDLAAAARGLELLGFQQALGRGWRSPQDRTFVVVVQRYATTPGAEGVVEGLRSHLPGTPFRSEQVPTAVAYETRREGRDEQHATFSRGPYVYELTFTSPEEDEGHALFELLLGRQAAHAGRLDPEG